MNTKRLSLILLFIFIALFRLSFTLTQDTYSTSDAYFHERVITHLVEEKNFLTYDSFSYGGRELVYPPFFYFLMALLSLGSSFLLKILPELFFAATVFPAYLLSYEISRNKWAALAGATFFSFLPLFLWETTNSLSPDSLFIPLLYLGLYAFLHLENRNHFWIFMIIAFILPFTSEKAYLLPLALLFYFFLQAGGALNASKLEKEATLFSILSLVFVSLLLYKKAFLAYGLGFIWQNIPNVLLSETYRPFTSLELILTAGLLPLLLGGASLYFGINKEKNKPVFVVSGLTLAVLTLLLFRLLPASTGLLYFSMALALLSSLALHKVYLYLQKTKFSNLSKYFVGLVGLLIILTILLPAYTQLTRLEAVPKDTIVDLTRINELTSPDATVLGNLQEGHLITSLSKRKNVLDTTFLLAPAPVERLKDVQAIYTTWSQAKALEYIHKYNITAIYLSPETERLYGIKELTYATPPCFTHKGGITLVSC